MSVSVVLVLPPLVFPILTATDELILSEPLGRVAKPV